MRDVIRWDVQRQNRHAYVHFTLTGELQRRPDDAWPLVRRLGARSDPMAALCAHLPWLGTARPPRWLERTRDTLRLLVRTFVEGPIPADAPSAELPEG